MAEVSSAPTTSSPQPVESVEVEPEVKEEDGPEAPAEDGNEDIFEDTADGAGKITTEQYKALKTICDIVSNHKIERKGDEAHYPSQLFRRVPNKRILPDYYEIIKEPTAISTLKGKIQSKKYDSIAEFVRDFALIVHNAQVYNRPNSAPVRDVLELKAVFENELKNLVKKGLINDEDTIFPNLGEIPYATPEPDPVSEEDEEGDEDGEDDEEDEEGDDSDDDKGRRGRKRGPRVSLSGKKRDRSKEDDGQKGLVDDPRKKRGRPPRVDTPMEARIKAVLKGIRKFKDKASHLKVRHFEKLPDKAANPHYFTEITEPIAIDLIKRRSKRKKYQSLEHFMKDLELMFKNAMEYNEDSSDIYKDAADLLQEAQKLADAERKKPDSEYMMEDGRLPLPNGILHNGELWKVGDWVHIQNPNNVTKPIVAQIYRTWQDPEGQKWVNACWYYRPEQTVHQYEKHFYPNEVVKTGQYRDHQIDEIVDRCFVMFFTRYNRGRPRNLDPEREVYVCEARYNEEKHKLNKIKTWASCLPDEVREKDYEMDLFDVPRKIKKLPSPLKHLLKDDAKETDEIPSPEWGHPNAPPVHGAVHRQPRDENQSPPPEPTPPPPPTPPPQPIRAPSHNMLPRPQSRASIDPQREASLSHPQQPPRSSPSVPPPSSQQYQPTSASPGPTYTRHDSFQQPAAVPPFTTQQQPQTPSQQPGGSYSSQPHHLPQPPQAPLSAAHSVHYTNATPSQAYARHQLPAPPPQPYAPYPLHGVTHAPRPTEVYVMADAANSMIPAEIRSQFPQDDQGRVLWFTTPPVETRLAPVQGRNEGDKARPFAHSLRYLAKKAQLEERKRQRDLHEADGPDNQKKLKPGAFSEERDADGRIKSDPGKAKEIAALLLQGQEKNGDGLLLQQLQQQQQQQQEIEKLRDRALLALVDQMESATEEFYRRQYGDQWHEYKLADEAASQQRVKEWAAEDQRNKELEKRLYLAPKKVPVTGFNIYPGKGVFKDDYDARY